MKKEFLRGTLGNQRILGGSGTAVTNRAVQSIKQGIFTSLDSAHLTGAIQKTYQPYLSNRLEQCIPVAHNARRYPKGAA
jgi:hypothetical protein